MNERIRQLAEQAEIYAGELIDEGADYDQYPRYYTEKLAELIIRECIQAVKNVGGYNEEYHMNAIKKYFGVEE